MKFIWEDGKGGVEKGVEAEKEGIEKEREGEGEKAPVHSGEQALMEGPLGKWSRSKL